MIRLIPPVVALLFIAVLSASCNDAAPQPGSDKGRWKKWATKGANPTTDFRLSNQDIVGLVFAVSRDREQALYADLMAGLSGKPRITLVDLRTGKEVRSFPTDPVQCLAFTRSGKTAVSGEKGGTIRVWRLADGSEISQAQGHTEFIRAIACSPVEDKAATGAEDGEILIWSLDDLSIIGRLRGHTSAIRHNCLTWSSDGKRILSGNWDGSIRLWNVDTGDELAKLDPGYGRVVSIALSPDGKRALASYLGPVILWDLEKQRELHRFEVPGNPWVTGTRLHVASVAFSSSGESALFGMAFGSVILWNIPEWKEIAHNRIHDEELAFVCYTSDGNSSLSVGCDHDESNENASVRVWKFPMPNGEAPALQAEPQAADKQQ